MPDSDIFKVPEGFINSLYMPEFWQFEVVKHELKNLKLR